VMKSYRLNSCGPSGVSSVRDCGTLCLDCCVTLATALYWLWSIF